MSPLSRFSPLVTSRPLGRDVVHELVTCTKDRVAHTFYHGPEDVITEFNVKLVRFRELLAIAIDVALFVDVSSTKLADVIAARWLLKGLELANAELDKPLGAVVKSGK